MPWSDGLIVDSASYEIAASTNVRIRVLAGPGTGKSFAMKRRVARLLEEGVDPRHILAVTFTRVAAEDLHRELMSLGVNGCERLNGRTLHSLGMKILSRNHVLETTGRVPRPLNLFELEPLYYDLMKTFPGKRNCKKNIRAFESAWARLQQNVPGHAQSAEEVAFELELVNWLRFHRGMLIGEIIPRLFEYLRMNPAAPERSEFSHVLVDEFQDLNRAEQNVIDLLSSSAELCVVGDDDQSIYSFKHAHPDGIREWILVNDSADDVALAECRRCPTRVVSIANSLIGHNQLREPRQLVARPQNGEGVIRILQYPSLFHEAQGVAQIVLDTIAAGAAAGDILILAQRRVVGNPIQAALEEFGVPVKSYFAESELDSTEAQRALALLKLFVDREDRIALRWLLGDGYQTFQSAGYFRVRQYCERIGSSPWATMTLLAANEIVLPYTGTLVTRFTAINTQLASLAECEATADVVDALFPDGVESLSSVREVAIEALEGAANVAELLEAIVTAIAQPEIPMEIEQVRIMSLHKSKGLSSPIVFIAGCMEGLLPSEPDEQMSPADRQRYIEEQRRLFYVGITRVKSVPEDGKPGTLVLSSSTFMPLDVALAAGIRPAQYLGNRAALHASRFMNELGPAAPEAQHG